MAADRNLVRKYLGKLVAGVAQAGKAVVLGTGKAIDEISITLLKIGGTAVTATAAQLNKLVGIDTGAGAHFAQFVEAAIAYNDNAKALFTIPNGAKIYSVSLVATTGFNGTSPTYDIGYAADPDAVIDGLSLPATAGSTSGTAPALTAAQWSSGVTSGVLIGTFAGGGSNTAGEGKVRVAYYL